VTTAVSHISLGRYANQGVLLGREEGTRVLALLRKEVAGLESDVVALDFEGVRAITAPFADACIGQFVSDWSDPARDRQMLIATNCSDDVAQTLHVSLRGSGRVLLLPQDQGPWLLGGERQLQATISAAHELGEFTTYMLAERFGLTGNAANERVRRLLRSGALGRRRVAGAGREYQYWTLAPV
jgi:hypothetical protein